MPVAEQHQAMMAALDSHNYTTASRMFADLAMGCHLDPTHRACRKALVTLREMAC